MVSDIYKKSFSALKKQPFRLWGIALLGGALYLAACIGFIGVPAAAFCADMLLSASLAMIFLNSYRTGLEPKTTHLFSAFRKERIWRVLGGMAWSRLWIFLWSLIPVVGIVFGVIRAYEYAFVPYILMTREDVKPTEAIKISKQETMGYKGKMFGADMLLFAVGFGVTLVLALLGLIPYIGGPFRVLRYLANPVLGTLITTFSLLLDAAFYAEIQNRRAAAQQPASPVPPVPPVFPAPASAPETRPAPQGDSVQPEQPDAPTQPIQYDAPAQSEQPAQPEWPDAPTQPIQYDAPAQSEPVTLPAPQGKPVASSPEPEAAAQAQPSGGCCPHCGAPVKLPNAIFCTVCGRRMK